MRGGILIATKRNGIRKKSPRQKDGRLCLLTRSQRCSMLLPMNRIGRFRKNFVWLVFLVGFVWLLPGTGTPPAAYAMSPMGASLHSSKGTTPSSCPMKGRLPCCRHKAQVSLCRASLCDLCLLSHPRLPGIVSQTQRLQAPLARVFIAFESVLPAAFHNGIPIRAPFPPRFSFAPSVNRPLLI